MRRFFKALGLIAGAGLALLIAGTLVPRPLFSSSDSAEKSVEILVITNPIHTDIAIPANSETLQAFAFLQESGLPLDAPGLRWIVFGWGGRAFYLETPTWAQLKLVPALKALTIDRSVLHAELAGEIERVLPNVKSIRVSDGEFSKLLRTILDSFDPQEPAAIAGAGYGPNDKFFEANGYFNVLFSCNTWAAKVLRAGGVQTGWWNPLPQSLGLSINLHKDGALETL
jgi:uncharacterized protein (TIGR02117 family)